MLLEVGDGLYDIILLGVVLGSGGNAKVGHERRSRVGDCRGDVCEASVLLSPRAAMEEGTPM